MKVKDIRVLFDKSSNGLVAELNGGERDEVLELKFKSIGIAQRAIVSAVSTQ